VAVFQEEFSPKLYINFLVCPIPSVCHIHLSHADFITVTTYGDLHKTRTFSLCNNLKRASHSSLLDGMCPKFLESVLIHLRFNLTNLLAKLLFDLFASQIVQVSSLLHSRLPFGTDLWNYVLCAMLQTDMAAAGKADQRRAGSNTVTETARIQRWSAWNRNVSFPCWNSFGPRWVCERWRWQQKPVM
jgi:hypothetical protein